MGGWRIVMGGVKRRNSVAILVHLLQAVILVVLVYSNRWKHLPPPGVAIAFAAGAALVNSLVSSKWLKHGWGLIFFFLVVIEIRAIQKDRVQSTEANMIAQSRLNEKFASQRQVVEGNFQRQREDQNKKFLDSSLQISKGMEQENTDAKKTIQRLTTTHSEVENRLASSAEQQTRLLTQQRELSEQQFGRLIPANLATPANACSGLQNSGEDDFTIIVGTNAVISNNHRSLRAVAAGSFDIVRMDRKEDGSVYFTFDARDESGKILIRIDKNGTVNRSSLILLHPDKSTVLLQNDFGKDVMTLKLVNSKTLQISGFIPYCGKVISLFENRYRDNCVAYSGVGFALQPRECPVSKQ